MSRCTTFEWRHSMANANLYKSRTWAFFAILSSFFREYILYNFLKYCDHENIGRGRDVQHCQWRHSTTNTEHPV